MTRNRRQARQGQRAGDAGQEIGAPAGDSFDFEVVPSRRNQRAERPHRTKREASDDGDLQRAVWDVMDL